MRFGSSNFVYKKIFGEEANANYEAATYKGVAKKTFFFLSMVLVGAIAGGLLLFNFPNILMVSLIAVSVMTFIFALIAMLSPSASKVCGTIYCLCEGLLVGVASIGAASITQGAVGAALLSTTAVFAVVTTLFMTNIIKVNSKFTRFLVIFAISFIISQVLLFLLSLATGVEYSLGLQLGISAISTFLASLYLLFDLENIRRVVEGGYPAGYEWYASFGLVFTLVWLYVEILRIAIIIFGDRN